MKRFFSISNENCGKLENLARVCAVNITGLLNAFINIGVWAVKARQDGAQIAKILPDGRIVHLHYPLLDNIPRNVFSANKK